MTNYEAIQTIKSNYPTENYTILREALNMAMKALENEKCGCGICLTYNNMVCPKLKKY